MGFVLFGYIIARGELMGWGGKLGLAVDLTHGDKSLGEIVIELFY
jgi:hypothetical protein